MKDDVSPMSPIPTPNIWAPPSKLHGVKKELPKGPVVSNLAMAVPPRPPGKGERNLRLLGAGLLKGGDMGLLLTHYMIGAG